MTDQRITLNPNPPVKGQPLEICYAFDGSGVKKTTLRVTFDPGGQQSDDVVDTTGPCVTVTIPAGSTSITVEDLDGPSPDKAAPVV